MAMVGTMSAMSNSGKPCGTCGLMAVEPNGVAITDERKWLTAPSPCPECMEEAGERFRELGRQWAKMVNDAVMDAALGPASDCDPTAGR